MDKILGKRLLRMGEYEWEWGKRTWIMGILNVTPDSFSDGGQYLSVTSAVTHARRMVAEGADIIDVGGESTRPGFSEVSLEEELERVIPVIKALSRELSIPISIDSYKAETARRAVEAGAHIINDIWGFKKDPDMAAVAAKLDCPVILMHNREVAEYGDLLGEIRRDLLESVALAVKAGVREENIILDPGIGFGKNYEHNLELMRRLSEISDLGYPVLLGTSRKTFIRKTLNLPADDVLEGTAATTVAGIMQGCDIVRVHDVGPMKRTARMADAMFRR
ncbi:dihydropteroate synthase [Ferviditalea candida]|uniref:Dihydropteroate synthase n=1 Tax=Ferviditalea candida TaxID=3108399 RepID=A0ABU5ZL99_9BACL|nr:dihydropteroate synthase [Paenibacillaceae bacterium T2]